MLKLVVVVVVLVPVLVFTVALLIAAWPSLGLVANILLWSLLLLLWMACGFGLYLMWAKASVHRAKAFAIRAEARKIHADNRGIETLDGQVVSFTPGLYGSLSNLRQIGASAAGLLAQAGKQAQAGEASYPSIAQDLPLAEQKSFPCPARMEDYLPEEGFIYRNGELFLALGVDREGEVVGAGLSEFPHILLGGKSRFGKSTCALAIVQQALSTELLEATRGSVRLALADKTGITFHPELWSGMPGLWRGRVAFGEGEITGLFYDLLAECNRRGALFRGLAGQGKYPQKLAQYNGWVPREERLPQVIFIIEEFNAMCEENRVVKELAYRLVIECGKYGITVVAMGQNFKMEAVGAMKQQLSTRVYFGEIDRGTRAMFDFASKLQISEEVRGRGLVKIPGHHHREIQGLYVPEERVIRLARRLQAGARAQGAFAQEGSYCVQEGKYYAQEAASRGKRVGNNGETYGKRSGSYGKGASACGKDEWQAFVEDVRTAIPGNGFKITLPLLPEGVLFDTAKGASSSDTLQIEEAIYTVIAQKDERSFDLPANEGNPYAPDEIPPVAYPPVLTSEEKQLLELVQQVEAQVGFASLTRLTPSARQSGLGGENTVNAGLKRLKNLGLVETSGPRSAYRLSERGHHYLKRLP